MGTGLWKRSSWTLRLLKAWWQALSENADRNEQEVLEQLLQSNELGCQDRIAFLPAGLLNSESASPISGPSWRQPVVHLAGMPDQVREAVFRQVWQEQCFSISSADSSMDRPASGVLDGWWLRDLLLEELQRYVLSLPDDPPAGSWTEASTPARVSRRLALALLRDGSKRDKTEAFFRLAAKRTALLEAQVLAGAAGGPPSALPMALMTESMAGPLLELGRPEEARALLLRPRLPGAGPRHSLDELVHAENLAAVLQAAGDIQEAEVLVRRALSGLEVAFPASAKDIRPAGARGRLAQLLHLQGRSAEAEPLLRSALKAYEDSLGRDHPQTLGCVRNLAVMLKQLPSSRHREVLPEAEALLRRASEGYEASLGSSHPDTERARRNLANFRRWRERQVTASEL
ncbi:unnamed protein product [Polarella glacialis]|uniref:Kinesin light chain n=1 Tax=Polarella glacialis TaxID=89957 RepID=A0A813JI15_POLGL|nr:unnamed protein product [Polarella glacialis]